MIGDRDESDEDLGMILMWEHFQWDWKISDEIDWLNKYKSG